LDLEKAFNTISRPSFLAELYKNPELHLIIPLVEMIYSRDSTVCILTPMMLRSCTARFSLVRVSDNVSRTGVRSSWPAFVQLTAPELVEVILLISLSGFDNGHICTLDSGGVLALHT
jgi:hypothetical protein